MEDALEGIGAERQEAEDEELFDQLDRLPDLTDALREASPQIKRQVLASFDLRIAYDSDVVVTDIAGTRFVSRCDARIVERVALQV